MNTEDLSIINGNWHIVAVTLCSACMCLLLLRLLMCPFPSRLHQWQSPRRVSWVECWRCCSTAWPATRVPSTFSIVLQHREPLYLRLDYWVFSVCEARFISWLCLEFLAGWLNFSLGPCSFLSCSLRRKRSSVLICACDCWGAAAAA